MWQYIQLLGPVGKGGKNHPDDVRTIQARLNHWIYKSYLPDVDYLPVDGDCGDKTKRAIGAFQFRIMGHQNPDCRVDPGGKTLEALFQSLLTPLTENELAYAKWLQQQTNPPAKPKPPKPKWRFTDEEISAIRNDWGLEISQYAMVPPAGDVETKEFNPPLRLRDKYETIFVWKSDVPQLCCAAAPRKRFHVLPMLRSDYGFWSARMPDNRIGVEMMVSASACSIRDFREFVIQRKMCPESARLRLIDISKDVIFQMFLGMFQLMSPVGVPTAFANPTSAVAGLIKAVISWNLDKEGKPIYKHF